VVSRPPTRSGRLVLATRALLGLPVDDAVSWHAVPRWCAGSRRRLELFLSAWERWVAPPRHLSADSPEGYAGLRLFRGEDPFAITIQLRTRWT
jgi:hypothetical protein